MALNCPDDVGEGMQGPVGERGAMPGGLLECGVEQSREFTDDGGFEEIDLAGPAPVDRHVRDAGVFRDQFDRRPFEPEVPEDADRAVENLRAGGVGLLRCHSPAFPVRRVTTTPLRILLPNHPDPTIQVIQPAGTRTAESEGVIRRAQVSSRIGP